MTNPNLLVSKVLRAKYFPRESILKCNVAKNASWIWQSFMWARDLIQIGTRKRVGNRKSTNIWEDSWLPGDSSGRVSTSKPLIGGSKKVEDLISKLRWNTNLFLGLLTLKMLIEFCKLHFVFLVERIGFFGC